MTQSAASELPAPAPQINTETQAFWDATTQGRLLLPRCNSCGNVIWYPREFCPDCKTFGVTWFEASGKGTIYSFTINRRGQGPFQGLSYVVAYVQLAEGPRMLTNIVDCDYETLKVGQPVELVFHDTGKGAALPRFRPA